MQDIYNTHLTYMYTKIFPAKFASNQTGLYDIAKMTRCQTLEPTWNFKPQFLRNKIVKLQKYKKQNDIITAKRGQQLYPIDGGSHQSAATGRMPE